MKLWKVGFVVNDGANFIKKEAIVVADTNTEALAILNRDYKLGSNDSIHCASAIKINFNPYKHEMIYCANIRR